jgi:hypothetical protein
MQVWILILRQGAIRSATIIRYIDPDLALIHFPDGEKMTIPREFVFGSHGAALRSLAKRLAEVQRVPLSITRSRLSAL